MEPTKSNPFFYNKNNMWWHSIVKVNIMFLLSTKLPCIHVVKWADGIVG